MFRQHELIVHRGAIQRHALLELARVRDRRSQHRSAEADNRQYRGPAKPRRLTHRAPQSKPVPLSKSIVPCQTRRMATRTGSADLPLHGGRVPAWLATRMAALGRVICEAIVHHYGRDELLRRLSHPFWFQSFGAVMGMDWHSSGITTSVLGALKRGLAPVQAELGLYVCGGRGRHSRATPVELKQVGERTGLDGVALARTSRLVAKIDSAAVQDGYDLYLHGFIVSAEGRWCVIQQGMNTTSREARRYHWLSEGLRGFLDSPHAAIEGRNRGAIVNLADARRRAQPSCRARAGAGGTGSHDRLGQAAGRAAGQPRAGAVSRGRPRAAAPAPAASPRRAALGCHAAATTGDARGGGRARPTGLLRAAPHPRRRCAHGRGTRPCRGTFRRSGALLDGTRGQRPPSLPPCRCALYDETLRVLRDALGAARLGREERLGAIRELDRQARALERVTDTTGAHRVGKAPIRLAYLSASSRASASAPGDTAARSVFGVEPPP